MGDRPAPRSDLDHVDHRRLDGEPAAPLEAVHPGGFHGRRDVRPSVLNETGLGGGPAHVEGDDVVVADLPPEEGGDQRASGRPRLEEADREPARGRGRRHAARGLDEVEPPTEAALGEGGLELGDVPGHEGLHVGVGRGGRGPLVFPEFGHDLGGE